MQKKYGATHCYNMKVRIPYFRKKFKYYDGIFAELNTKNGVGLLYQLRNQCKQLLHMNRLRDMPV